MKLLASFYLCLLSIISFAQSDTITTFSGLKYVVLEEGEGRQAYANRQVSVQYKGTFEDETIFDQSTEPFTFILGRGEVIKGWDEGVRLMSEGSKYLFIIPPNLAYGKRGYGDLIPPHKTLIFEVDLLKVSDL